MTGYQLDLDFDGSTYDQQIDGIRLGKQLKAVYEIMKDGQWRTIYQLSQEVKSFFGQDCPTQSASARLRDLRKPKFGGFKINRRRRNNSGTWEYSINDLT
jgi:hypothetical protein